MTDDRSLERAARSWIEVGPTRAPSHAVDAALLRIETTRQERDLRIPRRFTTMPMPARVAAAALIGVLLVGGAVYMFSPSNRSDVGLPGPQPAPVSTPSPAPSASDTLARASIPAGAGMVSRVQVGDPVAPRWFAADGKSLWVHEPTSLVRVDLATSAVTGQVPTNPMEYGYVTTGAGAVWQTDYESDTLVRIDPVDRTRWLRGSRSDSQPEGVAVTAGAVWVADEHDGAMTPRRSQDQPRRRDDPDRWGRSQRATDHDGRSRWGLGGLPPLGLGGADRFRDQQGRTAGAAGRPGGKSDGKEVWISV